MGPLGAPWALLFGASWGGPCSHTHTPLLAALETLWATLGTDGSLGQLSKKRTGRRKRGIRGELGGRAREVVADGNKGAKEEAAAAAEEVMVAEGIDGGRSRRRLRQSRGGRATWMS